MLTVEVLKADLLAARKSRDKVTEAALKRAIGCIESAEAPPAAPRYGVGPSEVARLVLTSEDVRACVQAEIDEALDAVAMYEAGGRHEEAARLRAEAAVLERYLLTPGH